MNIACKSQDLTPGPWMLHTLWADVQAAAGAMVPADDRERLIQALPVYRAIAAAYGQRGAVP